MDRACWRRVSSPEQATSWKETHHLVPDKVVDPVDFFLLPTILGDGIHHLLGTIRILSEWFLNDKAIRSTLVVVLVQLVRQRGELTRRYGELQSYGCLVVHSAPAWTGRLT